MRSSTQGHDLHQGTFGSHVLLSGRVVRFLARPLRAGLSVSVWDVRVALDQALFIQETLSVSNLEHSVLEHLTTAILCFLFLVLG